ncbi:hypothetical protein [Lutispora sp.]|uniref:hypothetical protein n=1 Tax=Lutispora sp. TaxID=2828727 RepID=UPI002B1EC661|nr:hypothetical protein [Lutispora sp.]MEA4963987.1 hypothetical protein [Lutispora sp.]
MQDLMIELTKQRKTLDRAISALVSRGQEKAEAERDYRVALAKEILNQRDAGMPVTIISDICRGKAEIAELKMKRDIADTMWETCLQKIYSCKINIGILEGLMEAERKGV